MQRPDERRASGRMLDCGQLLLMRWVWGGAVRCGAVRCGVVRCGAVWCGVWCGAVRCGVRCGVACGVVWRAVGHIGITIQRITIQPVL